MNKPPVVGLLFAVALFFVYVALVYFGLYAHGGDKEYALNLFKYAKGSSPGAILVFVGLVSSSLENYGYEGSCKFFIILFGAISALSYFVTSMYYGPQEFFDDVPRFFILSAAASYLFFTQMMCAFFFAIFNFIGVDKKSV
ncbi:hypothetical protein [Kushneria indalinina]|uniref:Uncharacterized protein n=1 Tax=Kushneria indalinina DSM 14324 TaxID=1122140 RepID=A0A3D9DVR0_9GAMM|nr:hypothetical protein [Kushneria indalinina]REC94863.1 hypothetical protein C8D72_1692 [Kushneria indalinina DSM 14324]